MKRRTATASERAVLEKLGIREGEAETVYHLRFEKGEMLYREGLPASYLMVLLTGRAKVSISVPSGRKLLLFFYAPPRCAGNGGTAFWGSPPPPMWRLWRLRVRGAAAGRSRAHFRRKPSLCRAPLPASGGDRRPQRAKRGHQHPQLPAGATRAYIASTRDGHGLFSRQLLPSGGGCWG